MLASAIVSVLGTALHTWDASLSPPTGANLDLRLTPRERRLTAQLNAETTATFLGLGDSTSTIGLASGGAPLLSRTVGLPILVLDNPSENLQFRMVSVAKQLAALNMTAAIVAAETAYPKEVDTYANVLNALERCTSMPSHVEFCMIFEDDAVFHPQLEAALSATVASLPQPWTLLHMCPGFAWGRGLPDTNQTYFHLNVKYPGCAEDPPSRCACASALAHRFRSRHICSCVPRPACAIPCCLSAPWRHPTGTFKTGHRTRNASRGWAHRCPCYCDVHTRASFALSC